MSPQKGKDIPEGEGKLKLAIAIGVVRDTCMEGRVMASCAFPPPQ